ncbi:MAG: histidinol-phosphate transaminase [Rhodospirillales bacterium]|nr:histidinol-phosphate transaminase [Rhodospirillales bacterium]
MNAPVPRPGISGIAPYVGGESLIAGARRVIKLASNESALGASPQAIAALQDSAAHAYRYPDGGCHALRAAIAQRFYVDADRVVCGAGSDELIGLLCRAYAGAGDEVLYSEHGFLMYPIAARAAGATPVAAPETRLTTDVDALLATVSERTRIVFIANPNNPTGTYIPDREMRRLRAGLPDQVLLVIDAAYAEYMDADDYAAGERLVEDGGGNVVMTRTFSKIFGLGGLRLGWAYCPPAIADILNRVRNPFNVSSLAQVAGYAAIDDVAFFGQAKAHNDRWRVWLTRELRSLGLGVDDSVCNFVLVRFPAVSNRDARAADAFLKEHGIITRRMEAYKLPDCLRITIGLEDEMRAVAAALAAFMG